MKINIELKGERCQSWTANFIEYLIEQGVIHSSARDNLSSAPRV
jgi:hypothetical protein